jgi:hypothetical protein
MQHRTSAQGTMRLQFDVQSMIHPSMRSFTPWMVHGHPRARNLVEALVPILSARRAGSSAAQVRLR